MRFNRLISLISLIIVFSSVVLAYHEVGHVDAPTESYGHDEPNWNDETYFNQNFNQYPADAFSNNPDMAWDNLQNNPDLWDQPDVVQAAFGEDPARAIGINPVKSIGFMNDNNLESGSSYLSDPDSRAALKDALISADNSEIFSALNEKQATKHSFVLNEYNVNMDQKKNGGYANIISLTSTNGNDVVSTERSTFTISDFPGAMITRGGELLLPENSPCPSCTMRRTDSLSLGTDNSGNPVILQEGGSFILDNFQSLGSNDINVLVTNGKVNLYNDIKVDGSTFSGYSEVTGSFTFSNIGGENFFQGDDYTIENSYQATDATGARFINPQGYTSEFSVTGRVLITDDLIGKGVLITDPGTSIMTNGAGADGEGYYSELTVKSTDDQVLFLAMPDRNAGEHCIDGISCVINIQNVQKPDGESRGNLILRNIQDNSDLEVSTDSYYDSVLVDNVESGSVKFISKTSSGNVESEISIDSSNVVSVKGDLSRTNAGRFDVTSADQKLQHWSSNENMQGGSSRKGTYSVSGYLSSSRDQFVTCTIGNDCEEQFASTFGKIIRSNDGSKPKTTIFVSGDNSNTPRSMERFCRNKGGCYILNSRDSPPTTNSENVVITGHHYRSDGHVWRDPSAKSGKTHYPIDLFHFSEPSPEAGLLFDHIPSSDSVKNVVFSACNTVGTTSDYDHATDSMLEKPLSTLNDLFEIYENLETVAGYDSTAPLVENINEIPPSLSGYHSSTKRRARVEVVIGSLSAAASAAGASIAERANKFRTRYVNGDGVSKMISIASFEARQPQPSPEVHLASNINQTSTSGISVN